MATWGSFWEDRAERVWENINDRYWVDRQAPSTPVIQIPKVGDEWTDRNPFIVTSIYGSAPVAPAMTYSEWEVALDQDFNNIIWHDLNSDKTWINQVRNLNDFINILANKSALYWGTEYWVRVRWANAMGISAWATPVNFTIIQGTDYCRFVMGGAAYPTFAITTEEKFFNNSDGRRKNTLFRNDKEGWYSTDIFDTTAPNISRVASVYSQHALRIPDSSIVAADFSYLDWVPEDQSYGVLAILWMRASIETTATISVGNISGNFDPEDQLTLRQVTVDNILRPFVLYYPILSNDLYSNERRLWVYPTKADVVTDIGTIDIVKCEVRDVIDQIIMPPPQSYNINFFEELSSKMHMVDNDNKIVYKGFRFSADLGYPLLSGPNEIKKRKIFNAEHLFMFPHQDVWWAAEVNVSDSYRKGFFANKLIFGNSGNIILESTSLFPKKPTELLEL